MTYRIAGLPRAAFTRFLAMDDAELAENGARRVIADADHGYPCRISLEDAKRGESLVLLNHVSHDTANPFRTAYAIYVREHAVATGPGAEPWIDRLPPVFAGRTLSLRGFDEEGMLAGARLASPDEIDARIRELFDMPRVACIHAHNAAHGCFAARIERHGGGQ
ncbi:Protein of unknown function [Novosphingobium sp. CF614]|uniref:DUF1203 domain-containing protein n=1 Tax=Novosphingobium sp. CF614 TaxID=1884364 RepID=UPI0008F0B46C|nr:DUF1203 domain-containing protein [Novosphingobium sp. CF614]SFG05829.1 Protein of unknown function [Novosphingobium sp. CF614]